jgi:hypothetical protein
MYVHVYACICRYVQVFVSIISMPADMHKKKCLFVLGRLGLQSRQQKCTETAANALLRFWSSNTCFQDHRWYHVPLSHLGLCIYTDFFAFCTNFVMYLQVLTHTCNACTYPQISAHTYRYLHCRYIICHIPASMKIFRIRAAVLFAWEKGVCAHKL